MTEKARQASASTFNIHHYIIFYINIKSFYMKELLKRSEFSSNASQNCQDDILVHELTYVIVPS